MKKSFISMLLLCFISVSLQAEAVIKIPAKKEKNISFYDDGGPELLLKAINRQIKVMKNSRLSGKVNIGNYEGTLKDVYLSVVHLKKLVESWSNCQLSELTCRKNFNNSIEQDFEFYRPLSEKKDAHYTSYFSPTFKASKSQTSYYQYGIHGTPSDPNLVTKYTRNEIVLDQKLEETQKALFYIDNPFDVFLLHVEGGGHIIDINTKKNYFLSYETTNRKSFSFIGPYMLKKGYISNGSVKSQRKFLEENPDKWYEIYDQTPNYVFFKVTKSEPLGMENIPLTPNRSLAMDRKKFARKGLPVFVSVKKPMLVNGKVEIVKHQRLYLDQDTGGAIKGEARADLYAGFGDEAQFAADNVNHYGSMLILLLKPKFLVE